MKSDRKLLTFILLIILNSIFNIANAQEPSFNISVNGSTVTTTCLGSTTNFTNTSSNQSDDFYWIIDGNRINSTSTFYIFKKSGTYLIQLINNTQNTSTSKNLIINDLPIATFTISNAEVCQGNAVTFTSTSKSNASIVSYNWNFGDDASVTTDNTTSYTYNKTGNKSTSLFVKDANGCTSLSSSIQTIKVNGSDAVSFTANDGSGYTCNNTIDFKNTSTATNATYTWDFGDGTSSTNANPETHTYASIGVYNVSLSANISGNNTCVPKILQSVYIGKPNLSTNLPSLICANTNYPLSALSNPSGFIQNKKDYKWSVSNGAIFNGDSSVISFSQAGNYTLNVTNLQGCPNTSSFNIEVKNAPNINFNIMPSAGICTSTPITFTVNSNEALSFYKWNFGDNTIDSNSNNTMTHQYVAAGTFSPSVTVQNSNGCSVTQSNTIGVSASCIDNGAGSVYNNVFGFSSECASKYDVTFYNKNTSKPFRSIIIDGTTHPFSNNTLMVHLTPKARGGTYSVQVVFADGSLDILREIEIMNEVADFTIKNLDNATQLCAQNTFLFSADSTTNPVNISNYSWVITDTKNNSVLYQNSSVSLSSFTLLLPNASTYSVQLTIYDKRNTPCVSTITKQITTLGSVGNFQAQGDSIFCNPSGNITIKNTSLFTASSVASMIWDFGDGITRTFNNINIKDTLQHYYNYTGSSSLANYLVTLKITNTDGCTSTFSRDNIFRFYNGTAAFSTGDTILCSSKSITINNTSNISDLHTNGFVWTVGNTTQTYSDFQPFNNSVNISSFPTSFDVSLKATYGSNITCTTEIGKKAYIKFIKPIAKFDILNDEAIFTCPPYTLNIENISTGFKDLLWTFDDTITNTSLADTILFSVGKPADYKIKLKIDGYDNCFDSTDFSFKAIGPRGTLNSTGFLGCMPYNVTLNVVSDDPIANYLWQLGDGNSYSNISPNFLNYTYTKGGNYLPTVTILGRKEDGSCPNTLELSAPIQVDNRINLSYQNAYTFCLGDTSINPGLKLPIVTKEHALYNWTTTPSENYITQGNTTDSVIYIKPLATTNYHIAATSLNTCPDEEGDIIVNTRESPIVTFTNKEITIAAGEYFYLNPNITSSLTNLTYVWTPSYRLNNPYIENPQAISDNNITYALNVTNQYGCSASDSIVVKTLCTSSKLLMANAFTPNGDGKNDRFYVSGYGIKNVKHFVIIDRWGKKVFERNNISANDITQGWDGNVNGKPLEPGTYIYLAELTCSEGQDYNLKGSVVLIR